MRSKCRHGDLLTVTFSKNGFGKSLSVDSRLLGGVGASAKYLDGPNSMIGAHPRKSYFRRFHEKKPAQSAQRRAEYSNPGSRDYPDKVGANLSVGSGPLPPPTKTFASTSVRCVKLLSILIGKQNVLDIPPCHLQRLILNPDSVDVFCLSGRRASLALILETFATPSPDRGRLMSFVLEITSTVLIALFYKEKKLHRQSCPLRCLLQVQCCQLRPSESPSSCFRRTGPLKYPTILTSS